MKVMLLAAGRGERMRPLTDKLPKPLLPIAGSTLIELQIGKLRQAGFLDLVINVSYLGNMIETKLGDGSQHGVHIAWSREPEPLETGGGIKQALPLLGNQPFGLVNADVQTDLDFTWLQQALPASTLVNLVMVDNPQHHPEGDFALAADGRLDAATWLDNVHAGIPGNHDQSTPATSRMLTYSGIGKLHPDLLADEPASNFPLKGKLDDAITQGAARGYHHQGFWCDVGTVDRYEMIKAREALN